MSDIAQQIKGALSLVDIISEYTELNKKGREFLGRCPFHNEKTPSFTVNEEKGLYHCFGCHAGGDMIKFIQEIEGITYPEALKKLAERAGIELEEFGKRRPDDGLLSTIAFAHSYFRENLSRNSTAQKYLEKRGVSLDFGREFGIGFAPDKWQGLIDAAGRKGIGIPLLGRAGLISESSRGEAIDFFRGGLIIPIRNRGGSVVAFGMRNLGEEGPKYINSREHQLYNKGKTLFGLPHARVEIRRNNNVYITEGYFDAISMWQNGYDNTVAGCGTALTEDQAAQLSRMAKRAILVYDGDNAGKTALLRAIPIVLAQDIDCSCVALPEGEDPDSYVKNPANDRSLLDDPLDFFDYIIDVIHSGIIPRDVPGQMALIESMKEPISAIFDSVKKRMYITRLAELLRMPPDQIESRFSSSYTDQARPESPDAQLGPEAKSELLLMAFSCRDNHLLNLLNLTRPFRLYKGAFEKAMGLYSIEGEITAEDLSDILLGDRERAYLAKQIILLDRKKEIEEDFLKVHLEWEIADIKRKKDSILDRMKKAQSDNELCEKLMVEDMQNNQRLRKLQSFKRDLKAYYEDLITEV